MEQYKSMKTTHKKMHKGKEREGKDKNKTIFPPVDAATRLDCCSFSACWSQWWSLPWRAGVGESPWSTKFRFMWKCPGVCPGKAVLHGLSFSHKHSWASYAPSEIMKTSRLIWEYPDFSPEWEFYTWASCVREDIARMETAFPPLRICFFSSSSKLSLLLSKVWFVWLFSVFTHSALSCYVDTVN